MNDEIQIRSAQLAAVSFPQRLIELIVMPYETPTEVEYRGRTVIEICSRTAYQGLEARNDRVRVNRDHDVRRTVGRAVAFHPSAQEGLLAEVRISKTELGEETLVLAEDGVLDASAGFGLLKDRQGRVVPNAAVWETRSRVRLNHLFLDHIGLTPDPAYESANILAVRAAGGDAEPAVVAATPNLDRWRLLVAQDQLASLDRRYTQR